MEKEQGLGRDENLVIMAKGKRTKRLRLIASDCGGATSATCTHSSANSEDSSSTTTYESTDQEDQDMANCLILLARGGGGRDFHHHHDHQKKPHDHDDDGSNNNKTEKGRSSGTSTGKFIEMATTTNITKSDFFIYECKTCNRSFPSFQALGGHRAGHKKPKFVFLEEKKTLSQLQPQSQSHLKFEESGKPNIKPISFQSESQANRSILNTNKAKIHECSICGSEFTSGQALGGHMRRHRAATNTTTTQVEVQHGRNRLELDLNLPAPEEDLRESKFQFPATQKSMVLSTLIDCHY
ncbi:unnamed protein product [Lupinus luteus]|uniref:C2H2-type domain-containing protein n=1 Tax=Lupinus luteus TaxID=3873 RepID=A0AAV1Y7G0_LUPLU